MSNAPDVIENTQAESHIEKHHSKMLSWIFSMIAIILMIPAYSFPILSFEKIGELKEAPLLRGIFDLYRDGKVELAAILCCCCLVLPVAKNCTLLLLSSESRFISVTPSGWFMLIFSFASRWGMLDVMLVTILLIYVNFGSEIVRVAPGPAVLPFSAMVVSSMAASWFYKH